MRFAGFIVLTLTVTAVPVWSIDVAACQEFVAVDRETETEVTVTNAVFSCEEYTRLSIRYAMVLKSSVGPVTFSNLALKVYWITHCGNGCGVHRSRTRGKRTYLLVSMVIFSVWMLTRITTFYCTVRPIPLL